MRWLALRLWLALMLLLTSCDGGTNVRGIVKDADGKPVSGAIVILTVYDDNGGPVRSQSVTTGEDGKYVVGFMHAPFRVPLSIKAQKNGGMPFEKRFYSTDHIRNLDINLEPTR
jgi:hypothetical protein